MPYSENSLQIGEIAIPRGIAILAKTLHEQRDIGLEIGCSADILPVCNNALYSIVAGKLVFETLEARNQCVAGLVYHDLCIRQIELDANEVFQVAHQLWCDEIGHNDSACGRFLALCHENVNILQAAATLINVGEKNVFDYLRTAQLALPFLPDLSVTDIVAISDAQYLKTKSDLAAGMFIYELEKNL